ncbi:hypothetical protein HWB76_gp137 [Streptomyces phage Blueeyedbeauty]|uniref:Uncharacterized protein n=1 Tax=Streptomyces phage Blueeyedbeauty TaxID=2250336 RepID=A0A345L1W3_9CAUD|nr:hypothetical protein HWB76_gp137 [Streptomyces phage Blueeyedbeauty]AXH49265.1 hypothetical protein SEA_BLUEEYEDBEAUTY_146 [Streptomyces phage Blueeyedbeauty]
MSDVEISLSKGRAILVKNILLNYPSSSVLELRRIGEIVEQLETEIARVWDENRDQDELCKCSHPYHRHFDSYEDMHPIGCKYCECDTFERV